MFPEHPVSYLYSRRYEWHSGNSSSGCGADHHPPPPQSGSRWQTDELCREPTAGPARLADPEELSLSVDGSRLDPDEFTISVEGSQLSINTSLGEYSSFPIMSKSKKHTQGAPEFLPVIL